MDFVALVATALVVTYILLEMARRRRRARMLSDSTSPAWHEPNPYAGHVNDSAWNEARRVDPREVEWRQEVDDLHNTPEKRREPSLRRHPVTGWEPRDDGWTIHNAAGADERH